MINTLLSVIVPVYNTEIYLRECLDSIINQSYQFLEIILVNDGSTDMSGIICEEYASKDNRIKVIHQDNKGMIGARYTGLCNATADYVTFVDSDDFINLNMYNNLMKVIIDNKVDMVTSGCFRYWGEEELTKDICSRVDIGFYTYEDMKNKIFPIMLWEEKNDGWAIDPSLCFKIIKKDILLEEYKNLKNFTFSHGEDSAVIYPAILNMKNMYVTHDCYYYHRKRTNNTPAYYLTSEDFLPNLLDLYNYLKRRFEETLYKKCLIKQLDVFYIKSTQLLLRRYPDIKPKSINKTIYVFPYYAIPKGSKIILYGAGNIGRQFWNQLMKSQYCEKVLWVDKNALQINNDDVKTLSEVNKECCEMIVIAIKNDEVCKEVENEFLMDGWDKKQIVVPDFETLKMNV